MRPYPTMSEFVEAGGVCLTKLKGGDVSLGTFIHCLLTCADFADEKFLAGPVPLGTSAEGFNLVENLQTAVDECNACCDDSEGRRALTGLPWGQLLTALIAAIAKVLLENK